MNKSVYSKTLLGCLIIMLFVWQAWAQNDPPPNGQTTNPDIGRPDPFAQLSTQKKTPLQTVYQQDTPLAPTPELYAKTVMVKFLQAANLQKVLTNMVSPFGTITTDKNSNSLIICDTEQNLQKIISEIKNADKTPQQIIVEVVILDVKLDDETKLGIHWDILIDDKHPTGFAQYVNDEWPVGDILNTTLFGIVTNNIANIVYALQEKRDVEILASPRIMVVSGKSSFIEAIEEIPYLESSQSSESQTVLTYTEFKDVGIKLSVTATLTDENEIVLTVETEQNVQTGTSGNVPVVDTRKAKTSLLLKDGQTVIMGGLRRQEQTKDVDQIPILGDLPLIGGLFRGTNLIIRNSELVVFIAPHIYKGEPLNPEETKKFNELRNKPLLQLPEEEEK